MDDSLKFSLRKNDERIQTPFLRIREHLASSSLSDRSKHEINDLVLFIHEGSLPLFLKKQTQISRMRCRKID